MTDKQTYRRGWERDFDIEATYYKAEHGLHDFLTINVELQNGYFSQRIECDLDRLFTLSDQIADMQRVVDDAIAAILTKKAEVDHARMGEGRA